MKSQVGLLTMPLDALRGYVRALRDMKGATQAQAATYLSMPLSTYKDWETGVTGDIKAKPLIRLVRWLNGDLNRFAELPETATVEDGERLARERVAAAFAPRPNETPEEARRINRLIELLASGIDAQEAARILLSEE